MPAVGREAGLDLRRAAARRHDRWLHDKMIWQARGHKKICECSKLAMMLSSSTLYILVSKLIL